MARYMYSLVRCVPDPRTGEFVNVGAIAGDPTVGDWSIRQVSNESRVRKLAGTAELGAVHGFLARVGHEVDRQMELADEGSESTLLTDSWLANLHDELRNVVQVTAPVPIVADDAETALDIIFNRLIIDPVSQQREYVSKSRIFSDLQSAYTHAQIARELIRPRVEVFVGDKLHTPVDFAIANGTTVQLAQAWSFQRVGLEEISTQVKAWGYTLSRLRDGFDARVTGSDDRVSTIDGESVDLRVVIAPPKTADQRRAYDEADEIFQSVRATVHNLDQVEQVSARAADLLGIDGQHLFA